MGKSSQVRLGWSLVRRLIFGSPLSTEQLAHQRLPKTLALPIFASDALSSTAYATQAILLNLLIAGPHVLHLTVPISLAIVVLLWIVVISYTQTVHAYPQGGGTYIVSRENLGVNWGLLAAAAILTDYVLTVAVSITAGVQQITSFFTNLAPYQMQLAVAAIWFLTLANLRGAKESGALFAIPTYFFVVTMLGMVAAGVLGPLFGYHPRPYQPPAQQTAQQVAHAVSLGLILRAFASGCAAMTGIEAVADGVQAFRPPESKNAAQTLVAMGAILSAIFLGISYIAQQYHIVYYGRGEGDVSAESVVSMVARVVFHDEPLLRGVILFATAIILVLAANTAYADFPRLSSILARHGYMPRQLANLGDRLVFSNGIILLAVFVSVLVVAFGGNVDRLIPLYAVGVFTAFTLSQAGMVRHWLQQKGKGWQWKVMVNGIGAVATGIVLLVIIVEKGPQGAWVVLVVIPILMWIFTQVNRHYQKVRARLTLKDYEPQPLPPHTVLVLVPDVHRGVIPALEYAREISKDYRAVHIEINPMDTQRLKERWEQWGGDMPLVIIESPYRSLIGPLVEYVRQVRQDHPRHLITVVLPEFVVTKWWERALHNNSAFLIKLALGNVRDVVITNVRYYLD
ncbi:MAG: amino acid permease [Armatimonadota bacterium]|nr:MAG: amino acid permease [Armatimonadota bacterium]